MAKTSVHVSRCSAGASQAHNEREVELEYVDKKLTENNESFLYVDHSLLAEVAEIKKTVKEKTGRKLQKNAEPLKEGVVVIDEKTTMSQLQNFCAECFQRFGMIPLQIHIHRDEGHRKAREWKPNLHAHIVWRMYNREGRNVRMSRQDLRDMQTIAAECLGMERGVSSNKKHLRALEYKIQQQEKQCQKLESNIASIREKLRGVYDGAREGAKEGTKEGISGVFEGISDVLSGKSKKRITELEEALTKAENTVSHLQGLSAATQEAIKQTQGNLERAAEREQMLREQLKNREKEIRQIEGLKKSEAEARAALSRIEQIQEQKMQMVEQFVEYGAYQKEQWDRLFRGQVVQSDHIMIENEQIPLDNPIGIRLENNNPASRRIEIHDQHWVTVQGFWNGIRKGITNAFEHGSAAYHRVLDLIGGALGIKR